MVPEVLFLLTLFILLQFIDFLSGLVIASIGKHFSRYLVCVVHVRSEDVLGVPFDPKDLN